MLEIFGNYILNSFYSSLALAGVENHEQRNVLVLLLPSTIQSTSHWGPILYNTVCLTGGQFRTRLTDMSRSEQDIYFAQSLQRSLRMKMCKVREALCKKVKIWISIIRVLISKLFRILSKKFWFFFLFFWNIPPGYSGDSGREVFTLINRVQFSSAVSLQPLMLGIVIVFWTSNCVTSGTS